MEEDNTVELEDITIINGKCPICNEPIELRKDGWYCDNAEGHSEFFKKLLKTYEDKKENK